MKTSQDYIEELLPVYYCLIDKDQCAKADALVLQALREKHFTLEEARANFELCISPSYNTRYQWEEEARLDREQAEAKLEKYRQACIRDGEPISPKMTAAFFYNHPANTGRGGGLC